MLAYLFYVLTRKYYVGNATAEVGEGEEHYVGRYAKNTLGRLLFAECSVGIDCRFQNSRITRCLYTSGHSHRIYSRSPSFFLSFSALLLHK